MPGIRTHHARLASQWALLKERALPGRDDELECRAPRISRWSVGQHIEHLAHSSLVMLDRVADIVRDPRSGDAGRPSIAARLALVGGTLPRGRWTTPTFAVPALHDLLATRRLVQEVVRTVDAWGFRRKELRHNRARIAYPGLGALSLPQAFRYLVLHQEHHMLIIDEIEEATEKGRIGV